MQTKPAHHTATRILALDLHPRSFGYVVMDGADRLLDWGVKRSDIRAPKKHLEVLVRKRFRLLLAFWRPDVVIGRFYDQKENVIQAMLRGFRREARKTSFLPVKQGRYITGGTTKHERASEIAKRFPEIGWKLPPKRKDWQSEYYSMSIFEAADTALSYFQPRLTGAPSEPPTPISNHH